VKRAALKYKYIAIEGNIGAGKTTLAKRLSEEFNARLILERFEDNSFLPKFYEQPDSYAFPLEMSFLADRYQQMKESLVTREVFSGYAVSDYFIDKSLVFARNNLKADEFNIYSRMFQIISALLPRPDLLIYLYMDIPRLLEKIKMRGRDYELQIKSSYLEKIQSGYMNYFRALKDMKILVIDINNVGLMDSAGDYRTFLEIIRGDYDPGIHRVII
jgi:deoxyadenosine/deoxycytidine kinase